MQEGAGWGRLRFRRREPVVRRRRNIGTVAERRASRGCVIALTVLVLGVMGVTAGCAGLYPVLIGPNSFANVIFQHEERELAPKVDYLEARGFGIGVVHGNFIAGYKRSEMVLAATTEAGFDEVTPMGRLAAGRAAEMAAGNGFIEELRP